MTTTFEVHYQDAMYSGYKFDIGVAGSNLYTSVNLIDKVNLPDVLLYRNVASQNSQLLQDKALITVNGYVHKTQVIDNKLWVLGGTKSMLKSRKNHIGILSYYLSPNNLIKYDITESMCVPDTTVPLYSRVYLTFPTDIKTPLLILNGYMQFEQPGVFYRIAPNSFVLVLSQLPYIERLIEANKYSDILKDMNLTYNPSIPDLININDATTNASVLKYLTSHNSFMVDLNVDEVENTKIYLNSTRIPNTYLFDQEPIYPLIAGYGKMVEYWKKRDAVRYNLTTTDSYYDNLLFSKYSNEELVVINDRRDPNRTYRLSNAYLLKTVCTVA
jgi:hypothetical protein